MAVPMKGQYEQQCNAAALEEMGIPVLRKLNPEEIPYMHRWIYEDGST
jgi:hypothetical protein